MRLPAFLLCFLMLLPSALPAQTAPANDEQPGGTIAVTDDGATDAAIARRIRNILSELEGYENIEVAVSSGIVTLTGTTLDSAAAARLTELVGRVEGTVTIENEVSETTDVVERLNPAVDRFRARGGQLLAFLPLALIALAAFAVIVLAGLALARMRKPWDRIAPNAFIADIYRQILRLLFVIGGLVVALDILGATALLSGILGAAGIVGLAIGFAVRDTVENFIASVMLSIRQPFRPNDTVEIEGDTGKVIRLTSRATILLSFDGNHIRIPNATVFKSRIVNYTRNAERRFTFALTVAPDADLAAAQDLSLRTLQGLRFVLKTPEASVWVESVDDCWVTLNYAAWIDQNETSFVLARSEAIRLCQAALDAADIAAPFPTRRVVIERKGAQPDSKAEAGARATKVTEPPGEVQDVTATAEKELARIVEQERAELPQSDLLSRAAREE